MPCISHFRNRQDKLKYSPFLVIFQFYPSFQLLKLASFILKLSIDWGIPIANPKEVQSVKKWWFNLVIQHKYNLQLVLRGVSRPPVAPIGNAFVRFKVRFQNSHVSYLLYGYG